MGRKGDSKRKTRKTIMKPLATANSGNSVVSLVKAASMDSGKLDLTQGGAGSSKNKKKHSKKS